MRQIALFFIRNYGGIYFLCLLGFLWFGGKFIRARQLLRRAMFGLERERGYDMQSSALLMLGLVLVIAGITFYFNYSVAPTLPQELLRPPPPTPNPLRTPLASPTSLDENRFDITATAPPIATLTLPSSFNQPTQLPALPTELAGEDGTVEAGAS